MYWLMLPKAGGQTRMQSSNLSPSTCRATVYCSGPQCECPGRGCPITPTNVFPDACLLLPQSREPLLPFLHFTGVGGTCNKPWRQHLYVCREQHSFGNSCLHRRRMLGSQLPSILRKLPMICELGLASMTAFCSASDDVFSTFQKCPHSQQVWGSLTYSLG